MCFLFHKHNITLSINLNTCLHDLPPTVTCARGFLRKYPGSVETIFMMHFTGRLYECAIAHRMDALCRDTQCGKHCLLCRASHVAPPTGAAVRCGAVRSCEYNAILKFMRTEIRGLCSALFSIITWQGPQATKTLYYS